MTSAYTQTQSSLSIQHGHCGSAAQAMDYFQRCGFDPAAPEAIQFGLMSLATMAHADIAWPNDETTAIGGNILLSAHSSSCKSFVLHAVLDKVDQYFLDNAKLDCDAEEVELLIEDANRESIILQLKEFQIAALISEEAGMLQRLLADSAALAKLLDCRALRHARVKDGRTALHWYRFCMMLLEQPDVFEKHKVLMGVGRGGIGCINRFFTTYAGPMRNDGEIHRTGTLESAAPQFLERLVELLEITIQQARRRVSKLPVLVLSSDAKRFFIDMDAEVRSLSQAGGRYSANPEYSTRHAERVLRLSGSDHVFHHGPEGEVQLDTLQRIDHFGRRCIEAFQQMTYVPPQLTRAEQDAMVLVDVMRCHQSPFWTAIKYSELRRYATNIGLTRARVTQAMAVLGERRIAQLIPLEGEDWVELLPQRFPPISTF